MNQVFKIIDTSKIDNKIEVEKQQTKTDEIIQKRELSFIYKIKFRI